MEFDPLGMLNDPLSLQQAQAELLARGQKGRVPPNPLGVSDSLGLLGDNRLAQQQALSELLGSGSASPPQEPKPDPTGPIALSPVPGNDETPTRQSVLASLLKGETSATPPPPRDMGPQRAMGLLGMLSGDRVLQPVGRTLFDQEHGRGDLRAQALEQGDRRLLLQTLGELRQGDQGDARLGQSAQQLAVTKMLGLGNLDARYQGLSQELQIEMLKAEERKQKQLDEDVQGFGKAIVASGAPEFYSLADTASAIFEKYPKNLPGFGPVSGRIPDLVLDKTPGLSPDEVNDAKVLRKAIGQALASYQKSITGAGASDAEREQLKQITGLVQSGNDADVKIGVEMLMNTMGRKIQSTAAGYSPDAVRTYIRRDPRYGSVIRVPASDALPPDSTGQPTLDTPVSGAPSAGKPARPPATQPPSQQASPARGAPSRPDKALDPSKKAVKTTTSRDGMFLREDYEDGTYGLKRLKASK